MTSELAIADVEDMLDKGLKPTPRDIIRLNALGLLIERAKNCGDIFALPRVSYLGHLVFREPTVGHIDWIDRILEIVNRNDLGTYLTVNAYALSRRVEDLVSLDDVREMAKVIRAWSKKALKPFTLEQIKCAVDYAIYGSDAVEKEYPEPPENAKKKDEYAALFDPPRSVGVGFLIESAALGLGLSLRDLMSLTPSQVKELQTLALCTRGIDPSKRGVPDAQAAYFRTRDAIIERLTKEKDNGEQH